MEQREQEFLEYVQGGGQVETTDWMPDEYRARLRKFIEMHGNSELMGVLRSASGSSARRRCSGSSPSPRRCRTRSDTHS